MRRIDELHLELPFYGSRRMTFELNKEGRGVNRKRVRRLMRVMGIEALVPRPGTSKAAPGHKIYPYLLRGLKIVEPNHVWAADVTYIPMACGFLYLVAIIDWASRAVLAWRLSNTNDASFCAAALEEALLRFGKPRIFNSDQGSTFTAEAHMGVFGSRGEIHSCKVKLRRQFRYPRSEPVCMTRLVSEHDQPHIRSPLETAAPRSRLRRAGAQGDETILWIGFFGPWLLLVCPPGSARTDQVLEDLIIC